MAPTRYSLSIKPPDRAAEDGSAEAPPRRSSLSSNFTPGGIGTAAGGAPAGAAGGARGSGGPGRGHYDAGPWAIRVPSQDADVRSFQEAGRDPWSYSAGDGAGRLGGGDASYGAGGGGGGVSGEGGLGGGGPGGGASGSRFGFEGGRIQRRFSLSTPREIARLAHATSGSASVTSGPERHGLHAHPPQVQAQVQQLLYPLHQHLTQLQQQQQQQQQQLQQQQQQQQQLQGMNMPGTPRRPTFYRGLSSSYEEAAQDAIAAVQAAQAAAAAASANGPSNSGSFSTRLLRERQMRRSTSFLQFDVDSVDGRIMTPRGIATSHGSAGSIAGAPGATGGAPGMGAGGGAGGGGGGGGGGAGGGPGAAWVPGRAPMIGRASTASRGNFAFGSAAQGT
ncbi:unnamed protein product, partial [Closterium sp. NIES-53]